MCDTSRQDFAGSFASGGSVDFVLYAGLVCSEAEGEAFCQNNTTGFATTAYTPGTGTCGPESPNTVFCDQAADDLCSSFDGSMSSERVSALEGACALAGGAVVTSCTSVSRVATCQYADLSGLTVLERYYPGANLVAGESDCADADGTWTAY